MFETSITFEATKDFIDNNQDILPIPSKLNIPKWFKDLDHKMGDLTVKGCMPFLDSLTAGYILKMPVDYYIEHNVEIDGEKRTGFTSSVEPITKHKDDVNVNYNNIPQMHLKKQLRGSPLLEKNKNLPVHKILNPWKIVTPPGYSTLFLPLMNNQDDRFSIIPGIVDTDTFNVEVNFPIIVNGDKYNELKSTIKRGTPYVQLIPFKRQAWKMKVKPIKSEQREKDKFFMRKILLENYKKLYWNKKSWK